MERYNYLEQVTADAKQAILENLEYWNFDTRDELLQIANDELWMDDSVTGNASGSYFCNAWKAEEAMCHNWDLLAEVLEEFGDRESNPIKKGAEWCDVAIRCYMLAQAIDEAIDELEEEGEISYADDEENEEE